MAPILGIWASSKSTVAADTGAMFPLQVITIGSAGASSVSFTNIPNTYTHLQLRYIARTTQANTNIDPNFLRFNSDTGNNYKTHFLVGNGSSANSYVENTYNNYCYGGLFSSDSSTASTYATGVIDILDYKDTNKYKTLRVLSGLDLNGSGQVFFQSAVWMSTSAISSITITAVTGSTNYKQNSQFALYGILGA
jgi:hypothetical protein